MPPTTTPPAPFLDRYTEPLPIRARRGFQLVSAVRLDDERRCVLVLPGAASNSSRVAEGLRAIERAHARIDDERVPRVTRCETSGDTPHLELDCDATFDTFELVRMLSDADRKLPFSAADALIVELRRALQAGHNASDPRGEGPLCLGRIAAGNALLSPEGRCWIVGFGRNVAIEQDTGAIDGTVPFFQSLELLSGGAPSPMGDYAALIAFSRSMLPYIEIDGNIGRLLRGDFRPEDAELIDCMRWVEQRVVTELPALRATMDEAIAMADRIRHLNGTHIDIEGLRSFIKDLCSTSDVQPIDGEAPADEMTITIGPDGSWIAGPDGQRSKLGRPQRRILQALVDQHKTSPNTPLTVWDLLEAGWPGEHPIAEAGANRVYVTMTRLRRLGLVDLIERFDDGYRLTPRATVRRAG